MQFLKYIKYRRVEMRPDILERAWPISKSTPEEKLKEKVTEKPKATKKEVDTGQVFHCPICAKKHRIIHIETEKTVKHKLQN